LHSDNCIFVKLNQDKNLLLFICVYVDDILILSNIKSAITETKLLITKRFKIKDLGIAEWILRIQIVRRNKKSWIGLNEYSKTILTTHGFWDIPESKYHDAPMSASWSHSTESPLISDPALITEYHSITMKLMYLAQTVRLDLLCTVNILAQYQQAPHICDQKALYYVLEHLRGTFDLGLVYSKPANTDAILFNSESNHHTTLPSEFMPVGFADASFAQEEGRKSRSGYIFMLGGCPISWYSHKQPTVSLSSTESEFISLTESVKEALYERQLLDELGFHVSDSTIIKQDNLSTIAIALDPIHHSRVNILSNRINDC